MSRSIPDMPGLGPDLDLAGAGQGLGLTIRDWPPRARRRRCHPHRLGICARAGATLNLRPGEHEARPSVEPLAGRVERRHHDVQHLTGQRRNFLTALTRRPRQARCDPPDSVGRDRDTIAETIELGQRAQRGRGQYRAIARPPLRQTRPRSSPRGCLAITGCPLITFARAT